MGTGMKLLGIQRISAPSCFSPKGSGVGLWLPGTSWGDSIRASQAWNQSLTPIKGCPAPPLWLSHLGLSTLSTFISMNYMWLCVHACVCVCARMCVCVFLAYKCKWDESNRVKKLLLHCIFEIITISSCECRRGAAGLSIHHASMLLYTCSQPSTTCLSCMASSAWTSFPVWRPFSFGPAFGRPPGLQSILSVPSVNCPALPRQSGVERRWVCAAAAIGGQ